MEFMKEILLEDIKTSMAVENQILSNENIKMMNDVLDGRLDLNDHIKNIIDLNSEL